MDSVFTQPMDIVWVSPNNADNTDEKENAETSFSNTTTTSQQQREEEEMPKTNPTVFPDPPNIDSNSGISSSTSTSTISSAASTQSDQPPPPPAMQNFPNLFRLGQPLLTESAQPKNDWEHQLFSRLDRIRERCGALCTLNDWNTIDRYTAKTHWDTNSNQIRPLRVPVDCQALVLDEESDASDWTIPARPPSGLVKYFTVGGLTPLQKMRHLNQTYSGTTAAAAVWEIGTFQEVINRCKRLAPSDFTKAYIASYGWQPNIFVRKIVKHINMTDARVLVIGTEYPWLESVSLFLGASHVYTLEYGKIISRHPRVTPLLPAELREWYRNGTLPLFDVVLSFSSLEHSGLGRYGDALNPWGDIITVAKARCMTKPGGYLGVAVPGRRKSDFVAFNELRHYGPYRWSLLTTNWEQVDHGDDGIKQQGKHVSHIFRNTE